MKLLITGGAGFLGARLARTLLARGTLGGRQIASLVIADLAEPEAALRSDPRVEVRTGALLDQCDAIAKERYDGVFHLAAAVSGECEADFDLGMRANLDTTRALLEALRAGGHVPRVVFASSVAVYGNDPAFPLPSVVRDDTLPTPQSSYGIQKFICEQLVTDHTRKGHIDGRSVRLMTVVVRPGRPNRAASGFVSGIVREPLAGRDTTCPVPPDTAVVVASPARAIEGLIAAFEADANVFGGRTALNLPALTVTVGQLLDALESVAGPQARQRVRFEHDATIARLVSTWPARVDAARSRRLGLQPDTDARSIVLQYLEDSAGRDVFTPSPSLPT